MSVKREYYGVPMSKIIRVKDKAGRTGTVIGQQHNVWFVHWDGTKYESIDFGSIDKDKAHEI